MVDEDEFWEAVGAFGYSAGFVDWVRDDTARLYAEGVRLLTACIAAGPIATR